MKHNCKVIVDSTDNHVIDIISDYDIAYLDLLNNGLCNFPSTAIIIAAYQKNSGKVSSTGYRFTCKKNSLYVRLIS